MAEVIQPADVANLIFLDRVTEVHPSGPYPLCSS